LVESTTVLKFDTWSDKFNGPGGLEIAVAKVVADLVLIIGGGERVVTSLFTAAGERSREYALW
jgi:hypothetical protein